MLGITADAKTTGGTGLLMKNHKLARDATLGLLILATIIVATLGSAARCLAESDEPNMLVNPDFADGLSGWTAQGSIIAGRPPAGMAGDHGVLLGPGRSLLSQEYTIPGLRIVLFAATLRADPPTLPASVRVQCYDAAGKVVMDLSQPVEPAKAGPKGTEEGIYFKTQAHTVKIAVSIKKDSDQPGTIWATNAVLTDYDRDRAHHAPACDVYQYIAPIWQGDTVYNETVLMLSHGGAAATGDLLFTPTRILSVQNYGLTQTYDQRDYTVSGRTITCTPTSRMTWLKDTDAPKGDFPWQVIDGDHIVVTYTHDENWLGPTPQYAGMSLPRTMDKLIGRKPLTIVALGDSITLGMDTSSYMEIPPYMPTWAELLALSLRQAYGDRRITLYNAGLGGMTSYWGQDVAGDAVGSLKPDLVIVAFGMNDFWSVSGDEFRSNIQGILDEVRKRAPHAEFLLVSPMQFEPAYTADPTYTGHMADYNRALHSLCGDGVQCLDMFSITQALYARKNPQDFLGNPLHPNDFLARWYAQGLAAMLTRPPSPGG